MKARFRLLLSLLLPAAMAAMLLIAVSPPDKAAASQPPDPGPSKSTMVNDVPSTITPQVDNGDVQSIAQVGNMIIIGGNFTSVSGQTYNHVAAFNATTGAVSTSFRPSVNGIVNAVAPGPNDHSVYVGGNFSQIGATSVTDLALLDLNTGAIAAGWQTPSFNFGEVRDLTLRGSRLYVGGTFTIVGGRAHGGLASLNATTGAVLPFMNIQLTGQHNPQTTGWIGIRRFDVTADGSKMVAVGNFTEADGLPRVQIVMIDLTGTSATVDPNWNTTRFQPTCFSWAFSDTVRGVSFSPDGSYFVVTSTGGGNPGTLCDAAVKFGTNAQGGDVQPQWIAESGGDSLWGVTATSSAIFVGGHIRWMNDPLGVDQARAGAVPRAGLAALDPISGRPLAWNPGRVPKGTFVYNFLATPTGLYMGSDTDWVGNFRYKRPKIVFFPYAGGSQLASTDTGTLPGSVFLAGKRATSTDTNVLYRVNAGGPTVQAVDNGPDWSGDTGSTSPYRNSGSNVATYDPGATFDSTVPSTTPATIYDSERWDPTGNPEMQWTFPVSPGIPIEVRLYLANRCTCTSTPGSRVFNVQLNGQIWLNREDLVADVGDQTATMKDRDLTSPANGVVTITFAHVTENPLVNGIEIIRTDRQPPSSNETDGVSRIDLSSTNATGPTTVDNGDIAWGQARGAFMVGNKVFYGATDNLLHSRTYNGATWGPDVKYNLYHDPAWANVRTGDGTSTFDGAYPSLYGEMPNVTGMFYLDGRLYYTEFGDSRLRSRWFSPDSGIVDETSVQAPSSVNFSDADGMFYANGKLYYVTASDGALHAVNFANGAVTGSPSTVSSPSTDGIDWRNRAMFLFNGSPVGAPNHAPAAAFSSDCKVNACDFDGSGSTDSDGSIASYAWDFGDGQSGTGAKPSHTYSAAGTYTVKLTVTDNDGATDSVSHGVTVTDPAPSAVSYVGADHSPAGSTLFKTVKVPATAAAGDTMLVFATGNTSGNPAGPSGVSGLQQLDSFTNGQVVSTVWKKTLAAGDPGATLRMDYAQYEKATLSVVVYSGVDGSKLDATDLAHSGDVSTDQHTSATVNASAGEWVVTYWADKSPSTDTWTAPAGVTQRDTGVDTGSGRFGMLLADSGGPVPAGQYGNLTATTNAASNRALMWTIRLTPA
jgi:PKD repeat protein